MPAPARVEDGEIEPAGRAAGNGPSGDAVGPSLSSTVGGQLLDLQRRAGNRAVGRLIARRASRRVVARSETATAVERDSEPLETMPPVTSPTTYEVSQGRNAKMGEHVYWEEVYWARFEVVNGNMRVSVRMVRSADDGRRVRSDLKYSELAAAAVEWFASQGNPVKRWPSEWSYMQPGEMSTNLQVYKSGLAQGLSEEDAARATPEGRVAAKHGFTDVLVLNPTDEWDTEINPADEDVPAEQRLRFEKQRVVFTRAGDPLTGGEPTGGGPTGGGPTDSGPSVRPASGSSASGSRPAPELPALPDIELVPPANVRPARPASGSPALPALPNLDLVPPANVRAGTGATPEPPGLQAGRGPIQAPVELAQLPTGGEAKANFHGLVLDMANATLNRINDEIQKRRAKEALAALEPRIARIRHQRPDCGVLLIPIYRQIDPDGFSALRPGPGLVDIVLGVGRDVREADLNRLNMPLSAPGSAEHDFEGERTWIPALRPVDPAPPDPPWPAVALATFSSRSPTLTDVGVAQLAVRL